MADQSFWGSELKRLGVGGNTLMRNSLSAQKLAKEIKNVLNDPAMSKRAISIGQEIAKENGVNNAVNLIEKTFGKSAFSERS